MLAIESPGVLRAHGWDLAFWIVSDEDPVHEALGVLARCKDGAGDDRDGDGWEIRRLPKARVRGSANTDDCEALARRGDTVYVFGSHFGMKGGPLVPNRHFIARLDASRLHGRLEDAEIEVEVARGRFKLHRLVNDALGASGLTLVERGPAEARRFIEKTRRKGKKKGKAWTERVAELDRPINVEGVTFTPAGTLLVGLRYPVTAEGQPILVEIDEVDRFFEGKEAPAVRRLWVVENLGSREEPRGVRALETVGREIHAITGSLDSDAEGSAIVEDHPEGARARSRHHRFKLPEGPADPVAYVTASLVRDFEDSDVEGLSVDARGRFWYVRDDQRIRLQVEG